MLPPQRIGNGEDDDPAPGESRGSPAPEVIWDKDYQEKFYTLASQFDRAPSYSPVSDQHSGGKRYSRPFLRNDFSRANDRDRAGLSAKTASLQYLPTEIVQDIVTQLDSDLDLSAMIKTSPTLYSILHPDETNCIWRQRFLSQYDYPHLESSLEFPFAYKVRQLVLRGFDGVAIANRLKQRSGHQLDVIKDMVLETYNSHGSYGPVPTHSKNLAIFSNSNPPVWLIRLMSCSLYGSEKRKYGQPHLLFDTLQVSLSHLVLSPMSPVLAKIPSSRDNYDLAKVYNYNKPFTTLLEVLEEDPEETPAPFTSSRFPNLKSPSPTPEPEEPRYRLNMHALLHIRNFWQKHFNEDVHGVGETLYVPVMKSLSASGLGPREWDQPLHRRIRFNTNWSGFYSCLHPWPKDRQDLEERQSCAEDWEAADPMTLDLETIKSNDDEMFWPPAFGSIPTFADLIPDPAFSNEHNVTYLRGIAPFKDLRSPFAIAADSTTDFPKWHPFLAARVNGFIHDIPDETLMDEDAQERRVDAYDDENDNDTDRPIPGWKHIVMVMWKPSAQYLLTVLDHAEEEYGGASGTQISAAFNTANVWDGAFAGNIGSSTLDTDSSSLQNNPNPSTVGNNDSSNNNAADATNTNININATTRPTEAEIEEQYKIRLKERITSFTKKYNDLLISQASQSCASSQFSAFPKTPPEPLPPLFSPLHIRTLEDSFSPLKYLDWDDPTIDYAYAYEGIIIPGGKIMMGRWWRIHGSEGLGAGCEIGPDGIGVEVRAVPSSSSSDTEDVNESGASGSAKGKAKAKTEKSGKNHVGKDGGGKRRSTRSRGKKRKARKMMEEEEEEGDGSDEEDFVDSEVEWIEEVEEEYEFVTVVNGEESRAVNGCKGLERGPFVFWAV